LADTELGLTMNQRRFTFDLFVFDNTDDYLCYVEAVHLLMHENKKKECDFLTDKEIYLEGQKEMTFEYDEFLKST
jgi:hypothetical protein